MRCTREVENLKGQLYPLNVAPIIAKKQTNARPPRPMSKPPVNNQAPPPVPRKLPPS